MMTNTNSRPATVAVPDTSLPGAHTLERYARYFQQATATGGAWAFAGPGVTALRRYGQITVADFSIVGIDSPMVNARTQDVATLLGPIDLTDGAPEPVAPIEVDGTFAPRFFCMDRTDVARTYRFGVRSAQSVYLAVSDSERIPVPVVRPFQAYLIELARYHEASAKSEARASHEGRAMRLYEDLTGELIDRTLQDMRSLTTRARRMFGLRHGDVSAFVDMHKVFLKDRSPRPKPPFGERVLSGFRSFVDWTAGQDLQAPDAPDAPGRDR